MRSIMIKIVNDRGQLNARKSCEIFNWNESVAIVYGITLSIELCARLRFSIHTCVPKFQKHYNDSIRCCECRLKRCTKRAQLNTHITWVCLCRFQISVRVKSYAIALVLKRWWSVYLMCMVISVKPNTHTHSNASIHVPFALSLCRTVTIYAVLKCSLNPLLSWY